MRPALVCILKRLNRRRKKTLATGFREGEIPREESLYEREQTTGDALAPFTGGGVCDARIGF